jgi:hypothetical protein
MLQTYMLTVTHTAVLRIFKVITGEFNVIGICAKREIMHRALS